MAVDQTWNSVACYVVENGFLLEIAIAKNTNGVYQIEKRQYVARDREELIKTFGGLVYEAFPDVKTGETDEK